MIKAGEILENVCRANPTLDWRLEEPNEESGTVVFFDCRGKRYWASLDCFLQVALPITPARTELTEAN